jgi:DNA-binding CsgD family transcriptional regulator
MLQAVGLTEFQERVYRALLAAPTRSLADLSADLGAGIGRVRQAVARLRELGLLSTAGRGRFVPVAPDLALGTLVQRRHLELNEVAGVITEFTNDFRAGQLSSDPAGLIEVVTSPDAIRHRALREYENIQGEVMAFDQPPYAWPPETIDEVAAESPKLERGVRLRVIYSQQALQMPGRLEAVLALVGLGEDARTLPELPVKLLIYDRRVALMPLTTADRALQSLAVIHPSGPLDALIALFEAVWSTATPVGRPDAGPSRLSLAESQMLTMLAAGVKDEAIARHLGISTRTARRRISAVLAQVHAATRFQAGANAVRHGLL